MFVLIVISDSELITLRYERSIRLLDNEISTTGCKRVTVVDGGQVGTRYDRVSKLVDIVVDRKRGELCASDRRKQRNCWRVSTVRTEEISKSSLAISLAGSQVR